MPVHDWTLVSDGVFHDFHTSWIIHLKEAMKPILPNGYYALAEQHLGPRQGDVLALHVGDPLVETDAPVPPEGGAVAVAEAPPKVKRTMVATEKKLRRTLTIRHVSGHRIIALVEIISPGNKRGADNVLEFVQKAVAALRSRIHLVVVDLFQPGTYDPQGIHGEIWQHLDAEEYTLPDATPLTVASYAAGSSTTAYVEQLAVGDSLTDMPLFLSSDHYVNLPLPATYEAAFQGMPDYWRNVLEHR